MLCLLNYNIKKIMKSIRCLSIVFILFFYSCSNNSKEEEVQYNLNSKLIFADIVLNLYVKDSLVCNYLYDDLNWEPFKRGLFTDNSFLLKKYSPHSDSNYIKDQMETVRLGNNQNQYFSNFEIISELENDSLVVMNKEVYGMTLPVFNEKGDVAFVGFSVTNGFLSGYGELMVFKKNKDKWKRVERVHLWIN